MKIFLISAAVVLVALAVVVPITQGLQCYICFSGDDADKNAPGYHKKCKEGKIPDSLLRTCIGRNAVNPDTRLPYNASEVKRFERQGSRYACGKVEGKANGKKAAEKFCTVARPGNTDICQSGEEGAVKGSLCICHADKCNGAISLNPIMIINILSLSALLVKFCF